MSRSLLLLCGALGALAACGGSDQAGATTSGSSSSSSGAGAGGAAELHCEGSTLLAPPADYEAKGPWEVSAKTVQLAGLVTEVWYPASPGSEAGKAKTRYDIREHLPASEQKKIPDQDNPWQDCDCYRDLPLDGGHGPYPLVVFVHGTAAFRTQSLTQMVHWASRGFVVVAADHPGIDLAAILSGQFAGMQSSDVAKMLDALATPSGDVAFLKGALAPGRIALTGHSAGGGAIETFSDRAGVRVQIPMAAGGTKAGKALQSSLILGGMSDGIVPYSSDKSGYGSAPVAKRLVGLTNAGHLAFSDLCALGKDQGGILAIAQKHGVNVPPIVATLAQDGCKPGQLAPEKGWAITNFATSAVLEESLDCDTHAKDALAKIRERYPDVGEYAEQLH